MYPEHQHGQEGHRCRSCEGIDPQSCFWYPRTAMAQINRFYSDGGWIEGASVKQLDDLAASSPTISAIAAMPDLHPGKYGPVGIGMLATHIHPAIVGSDIGCGMGLYRLGLKLRKFKAEKTAERMKDLDEAWDGDYAAQVENYQIPASIYDVGLGSIGGGNHFCELQAVHEIFNEEACAAKGVDKDFVHVLVHSGSRALGYSVLEGILGEGLPVFPTDSEEGAAYLAAHDHAVEWARLNRKIIAERAAEAARSETEALVADIAHNFLEVTDGGVIHRKGAAPANRGLVPIPGSRESLSYLVRPLDDAPAEALATLAHGAGRKYERGKMHGRIEKTKSERERMQRNPFGGIIVCEDRNLLIEEAGAAYKDIDAVIADLVAFGLVEVVATFRPLITFKTGQAHIGDKGRDR